VAWTTADLLVSVRERGRLSDTQPESAELLRFADHAIATTILPLLRPLREDYGTITLDIPLVAGQSDYEAPTRALNGTVEDVLFIEGTAAIPKIPGGDGPDVPAVPAVYGAHERSMNQLPHSEVWRYRACRDGYWTAPYAFAMRGPMIVVCPTPTQTTGFLRVRYMERPGALVTVDRAARLAIFVDEWGGNLDSAPDAFGTDGDLSLDIRGARPPFAPRGLDVSAEWSSGSPGVAFDLPLVEAQIGDWVTLAGETVIVPVPETLHAALSTATLVEVYQALGHDSQRVAMRTQLGEELSAARQILEPRVRGEGRPVIVRSSPLRGGGRGWGGRR